MYTCENIVKLWSLQRPCRKERLQDAFHAFDSDGNGTLDFGEVCKMADRLQITASGCRC